MQDYEFHMIVSALLQYAITVSAHQRVLEKLVTERLGITVADMASAIEKEKYALSVMHPATTSGVADLLRGLSTH